MVTAGSIASRRGIPTADKTHEVALSVVGNSAPERCFFLNKVKYTSLKKSLTTIPVKLKPGKSQTFELVAPANGKADKNAIIANGSFDDNYAAEKSLIQTLMSRLTMPVALPDAVEITIEGDKNDGATLLTSLIAWIISQMLRLRAANLSALTLNRVRRLSLAVQRKFVSDLLNSLTIQQKGDCLTLFHLLDRFSF